MVVECLRRAPQLPQHLAAVLLKQNPQPMTMNTVRKKGKSKRRGPHMVHRSSQTDLQCTQALQPRRNLGAHRRFLTAPGRRKVLCHELPFQLRRISLWYAQWGPSTCKGTRHVS
ncbi:hypothetical protein MRX96_022629 [Rhipicephalus microplus]